MKEKKRYLINENKMLSEAFKILEKNFYKTLIVINSNNKLVGTLSDGDIRRRLISTSNINITCGELANKNCIYMERKDDNQKIKLAEKKIVSIIPVINKKHEVIDIFEISKPQEFYDNTIVIMAGGLGKRLRPLTEKTPKPLLKVGDKPIIKRITDKFSQEGFNNFIISVGYLKGKFFDFYKNIDKKTNPRFIQEKKPLGTAGSLVGLSELENVNYPIIVTNGDVIFDDKISIILNSFKKDNIDGMMLCRQECKSIPYGVVESDDDHNFVNIKEKPKINYLVNGGVYILSDKMIDLINKDEKLDMPELFTRANSENYKIKIHVLENYWIDIGLVDNLQSANSKFK